ncbi:MULTISPECIES: hypothetical protein [Bradyrhizobium]|uniref:hypothetical protein n=1 Tax=Bradyrhizobium TaxID=374 RepID=UPI000467C803|nr:MULTISPECIES: hypothetical protein [Bradyrhizobium]KIU45225.1 hypothetical protein QU41_24940 [Bradyrhizobium elkanii]OCX30239.1 hypothetical protein QU42_14525 [Bradyrhizobium sp. UASWS1016]
MQFSESPRKSRGLVVVRTPDRKPARIKRLNLWLSTGSTTDGLWVGSRENKPYPGLRRVEQALQLIKDSDPLNYARVVRSLDRVWVDLIPASVALYDSSLNACVIDERHVVDPATTLERIASTIIHEATHARLEGWGIAYVERDRSRIEAICQRRELKFLARLPESEALREEIAWSIEWYDSNVDDLSDASFRHRDDQGMIEALRHVNAPNWLVRFALWVIWRRRLRRFAAQAAK